MKSNTKDIWIYIGIFAGAAFISIVYGYLMHTFGTFGGDSKYYVGQAQRILSDGLGFYMDHISTPYYWGYPTFLALCIAVVGENWMAVAFVQVFLSALSMIFLYHIVYEIIDNFALSILLTLFYKLILDTSMWDGRILSDSLGMTLECMTLYFFYIAMQNRKKKDYIWFSVFAFLFFTTRTNSISLIIILVIAALVKIPGKAKWIVCGAAAVIILAGLIVAGGNGYYGIGTQMGKFVNYFRQGEIVHGRPEYDYLIPEGHIGTPLFILDILLMVLLKAKYYWSIYFNGYSTVHIALCIVTILPIFLLTLFSAVCIIRDKQKQLYPFVVGIVSYSFFQICTEIDFDQRYRTPIFLLCIICSAYGMKKIYLWIRQRIQRKG